MKTIKIAIVGVGNCASALIQGLYFYRQNDNKHANGLMNWDLGGYDPTDIAIAAAFDIDRRKVGLDVGKAIFQPPNCTKVFYPEVPEIGVTVKGEPCLTAWRRIWPKWIQRFVLIRVRSRMPQWRRLSGN